MCIKLTHSLANISHYSNDIINIQWHSKKETLFPQITDSSRGNCPFSPQEIFAIVYYALYTVLNLIFRTPGQKYLVYETSSRFVRSSSRKGNRRKMLEKYYTIFILVETSNIYIYILFFVSSEFTSAAPRWSWRTQFSSKNERITAR